MHKGHYIHLAQVKAENQQYKQEQPSHLVNINHEVSLLKLRILTLEADIKTKDKQIDALTKLLPGD